MNTEQVPNKCSQAEFEFDLPRLKVLRSKQPCNYKPVSNGMALSWVQTLTQGRYGVPAHNQQ
jgi:hypothetical protein